MEMMEELTYCLHKEIRSEFSSIKRLACCSAASHALPFYAASLRSVILVSMERLSWESNFSVEHLAVAADKIHKGHKDSLMKMKKKIILRITEQVKGRGILYFVLPLNC